MSSQKPHHTRLAETPKKGLGAILQANSFNLFRARGAADNVRMNAMSDGVFAIVITLMVFSIKIPDIAYETAPALLARELLKLLPDFSILLLSFVILGIYWVGHNNVFLHVQRHDRLMLWLNILFLLVVALFPFPAALLIRYGNAQVSVILYGLNLAIGGILLDLIWAYATYNRHLMCDSIQPTLIRSFHVRILTGPVLYLSAIPVSFFSLLASKILFSMAIAYYLVPTLQDLLHHEQLSN